MNRNNFFSLGIIALLVSMVACGGGGGSGGSGDYVGSAEVAIDAVPHEVDTGDRIRVTINVRDVIPGGILLKLRYPTALHYVKDSANLVVSGGSVAFPPTSYAVTSDSTTAYLIFAIAPSQLGKGNEGDLVLELSAASTLNKAKIEVDPDVDDPNIPNTQEFNVADPQFTADDSVTVKVR